MKKVGLIGLGYIADSHLKGWREQTGAQVTALCDLDPEKLQQRAQQYGIAQDQLYTDLDEMLAKADVDIVDIATGPNTHLPFVTKAAAAGKDILCQKPFAPDLEQAEEMVRIADRAGVRLMVTENWRWFPRIQNIKRLFEQGVLGKVRYARYSVQHYVTPNYEPEREIPQPYFREMPRLLMYEMGIHWFDIWRFLFGEPTRLYAEMRRISPYIVGEDVATLLVGHEDFHGLMEFSWASRRNLGENKQEKLHIETDKASVLVYNDGTTVLLEDGGETLLNGPVEASMGDTFALLQAHFLEALEQGTPFLTSGEDNLKTLRLVFAAYDSAASGEVIKL